MKFDTIYLDFSSPLHIGNHKPEGYEKSELFLRSDTLLAAVMQTWVLIGKVEWIEEYIAEPSFAISSAFPFAKYEGHFNHFFPRPQIEWNLTSYEPSLSKKIKKVKWLDQKYFEQVIQQNPIDIISNQDDLQGAFLCTRKMGRIYQKEMQERVSVPRGNESDTTPFTMERLRFSDKSGLYFVVKGDTKRLEIALEILETEGIGTDRNIGNGQFQMKREKIDLKVPTNGDHCMNLGLYCPSPNELDAHAPISFALLKRGGWVTSSSGTGLRKFSVNMFQEGSVFKSYSAILGKHDINLSPQSLNHPVYRSGRSLFIPVKSSES